MFAACVPRSINDGHHRLAPLLEDTHRECFLVFVVASHIVSYRERHLPRTRAHIVQLRTDADNAAAGGAPIGDTAWTRPIAVSRQSTNSARTPALPLASWMVSDGGRNMGFPPKSIDYTDIYIYPSSSPSLCATKVFQNLTTHFAVCQTTHFQRFSFLNVGIRRQNAELLSLPNSDVHAKYRVLQVR